jgi:hypothetical protein
MMIETSVRRFSRHVLIHHYINASYQQIHQGKNPQFTIHPIHWHSQ